MKGSFGCPLASLKKYEMGPWLQNRTFAMNYFRGYFRSTSADFSPHFVDPWPSRTAFPYLVGGSCGLAAADYTLHSVPSMMHFKSAPAETALSGRALRMNSPSQCKVNPSVSPLSWFLPQSLPRFFPGSSAVRVKQQLHDSTDSRLREITS